MMRHMGKGVMHHDILRALFPGHKQNYDPEIHEEYLIQGTYTLPLSHAKKPCAKAMNTQLIRAYTKRQPFSAVPVGLTSGFSRFFFVKKLKESKI